MVIINFNMHNIVLQDNLIPFKKKKNPAPLTSEGTFGKKKTKSDYDNLRVLIWALNLRAACCLQHKIHLPAVSSYRLA